MTLASVAIVAVTTVAIVAVTTMVTVSVIVVSVIVVSGMGGRDVAIEFWFYHDRGVPSLEGLGVVASGDDVGDDVLQESRSGGHDRLGRRIE